MIVYMLTISPFDRLKTYAVLFLCIGAIIRFIYGYYCKRHFEECSYHFVYDKPLLKEMTSFAGWNFFGTSAWMLNTQGLNILINMYFGVAFNAARGIATQVDSALKQFINNFTTAVNPQITKSYAQGNMEYLYALICSSAKYSAFLMSFFAIPILVEADTILQLWLKNPPMGTTVFLRWIIVSSFIDTVLANPLFTAMMATGKIRKYQIVVSLVGVLVFPLSWLSFYLGYEAQTCYMIYAFIYTVLLFVKLWLLQGMIGLSLVRYVKSVIIRVVPIIGFTYILTYCLTLLMQTGLLRVIITSTFSTLCTTALIYSIGLSKTERIFVTNKIKNIYTHGYKK